jgi:hypothetical protein
MDVRAFVAGVTVGAIVGVLAMLALRPDRANTQTDNAIPSADHVAASTSRPLAPVGSSSRLASSSATGSVPDVDDMVAPAPVMEGPDAAVPPDTDDAQLRSLFDAWSDSPNIGHLNKRLKSEARDEPWASDMETQLRDYLARRPAPNAIGSVSIECRKTLCRLVSVVSSTVFEAVPFTDMQAALNDLSNESLGRELVFSNTAVSVDPAESSQTMEIAFLRSADPAPPT